MGEGIALVSYNHHGGSDCQVWWGFVIEEVMLASSLAVSWLMTQCNYGHRASMRI